MNPTTLHTARPLRRDYPGSALMIRIFEVRGPRVRWAATVLALGLLLVIGAVDYLSGSELLLSVFYLLAVGVATWYVGPLLGLCLSVLSALVWILGDVAAGAHYRNPLAPIWNALILAAFYGIVVALLNSLRSLTRDLEQRVEQRNEALRREMAERQRLEEEILQISEREQRRIAHDLHDDLCQHLTATSLAIQVLGRRLEARQQPEAADAERVLSLVDQGIELARTLARGLHAVELGQRGLMDGLQQLADSITQAAKVQCVFDCHSPVLVHDDAAAMHIYRIAQEAVRNALVHAHPRHIEISMSERAGEVHLAVEDDGVGLPESGGPPSGLGIRIMAYRASMIGGTFAIQPAPTGGTLVQCTFPNPPAAESCKEPTHAGR